MHRETLAYAYLPLAYQSLREFRIFVLFFTDRTANMEPAGEDEGADDNDELFVRPVVRLAAPVPVDIAVSSAEISGKRQRSQVIFGSSFDCRRPALKCLFFSPALLGVHGGTPKFLDTFEKI